MLGITVPDAIAFGTLVFAGLAAWRGTKIGEALKASHPPDPTMALVGAALADTMTMKSMNEALNRLADTIEAASERRENKMQFRMVELLERIEANQPHRRKDSP